MHFGEVLCTSYFIAVPQESLMVPSPLCGENGASTLFCNRGSPGCSWLPLAAPGCLSCAAHLHPRTRSRRRRRRRRASRRSRTEGATPLVTTSLSQASCRLHAGSTYILVCFRDLISILFLAFSPPAHHPPPPTTTPRPPHFPCPDAPPASAASNADLPLLS